MPNVDLYRADVYRADFNNANLNDDAFNKPTIGNTIITLRGSGKSECLAFH